MKIITPALSPDYVPGLLNFMCPWIKSLLQSERHYKRAIWGLEGPHAFACHSPLVTSDEAEM